MITNYLTLITARSIMTKVIKKGIYSTEEVAK
jgi:hypothetical protein